jgi:hypothetical protein
MFRINRLYFLYLTWINRGALKRQPGIVILVYNDYTIEYNDIILLTYNLYLLKIFVVKLFLNYV